MSHGSALVVVSHYNAVASDQLIALLDQMSTIPAGYPFRVRVVVNQAENRPLILPDRHADVEVLYRENTGYNIGAWKHGWRQSRSADLFLFLQDECVILKANWLGAFVRRATVGKVGFVGESLIPRSTTWDDVDMVRVGCGFVHVFGQQLAWSHGMKLFLTTHGIAPGLYADHLQSLIVCARREVLENIGGFLCGNTYDEAVCSEVAVSKRVQIAGYKVCQNAFRPFCYIHHPQWENERQAANHLSWKVRRLVNLALPRGLTRRVRRLRK